jgi:polysaccharide pyruvyl transferase WcaK-like protein
MGKQICVKTLPTRFSKNLLLPYHFLWLALCALIIKMLRSSQLRSAIVEHYSYFKTLYETDLVADITGGDSFSDIYGFRRFLLGFLRKWLVIFLGKKFILLPQTYGPFKSSMVKAMAKYILNRASIIYSRDQEGVEYVRQLIVTSNGSSNKLRFAPDVAFVLDSRAPKHVNTDPPLATQAKELILVGFNINGLLFNGGYTRDNMFGLKVDYSDLVYGIIELFMKYDKLVLLLVPHVFSPHGTVESDPDACTQVYKTAAIKYPGRIVLTKGYYDQSEIKHIIGMCDFFIGSRMHACIAALSQCIPAVGLAYSKKFYGVFESIGAEKFVIDMRVHSSDEILSALSEAFGERHASAEYLKSVMPQIQQQVLTLFKDIS